MTLNTPHHLEHDKRKWKLPTSEGKTEDQEGPTRVLQGTDEGGQRPVEESVVPPTGTNPRWGV